MNRHTFLAALLLASGALVLPPTFADDAHHPDQKADAAAPAAEKTIQKMQANIKKMQTQLEKIARSKDPKERQQLMKEHLMTMQENMRMGQGMMGMGCPMMSDGMGMMGGGMGQGMGMMGPAGMGPGGGPDATMNRIQMLEKRMDMMQMMLEQMSKGQQAGPAMK